MKKLLLTLIITGFISFLFGNYIFTTYQNNINNILNVSKEYENIYMLLYGSYNSIDKVNNLNLDNYILEEESGYYKVYVGITFYEEDAKKIREIYRNIGNDIYIKEKLIDNLEFINYIKDIDFNKTNEEILKLQKDIINKYKEVK